ncbi:hypothetical protein [Pelagibius sp. 7325]|uniref:hypothetical protein n=1 Tax=Pelagibius sp. 7325 TaxID=3131994 RepID=UPI0030EF5A46
MTAPARVSAGIRQLARSSAGFLTRLIGPGMREVLCPGPDESPVAMRPYRPETTAYPVWVVEPKDPAAAAYEYIHTFFDICPFSPSQRYLAVTRMPYADRQPVYGDEADVCVIDLESGILRRLYTTKGWALQLGAQAQWGADDRTLYTNDVIGGRAVGVRLDVTGTTPPLVLDGPAYHVSPDGRRAIGPALDLLNATQLGYGVPEPVGRERRLPPGASADEGLWCSDTGGRGSWLFVSLADFARHLGLDPADSSGTLYLFHSKLNADGSRIMQVIRRSYPKASGRKTDRWVVSLDAAQEMTAKRRDTAMATVVGADVLARRGHHPNWHPDGRRIVLNATPEDGAPMLFCQAAQDGSGLAPLSERIPGSGHPSIDSGSRYLLTDTYPFELQRFLAPYYAERGIALPAGEVPLRLVDLGAEEETTLCTVNTLGIDGPLRLDPHPAWSRDFKRICFNGAPEGRRRVMLAHLDRLAV